MARSVSAVTIDLNSVASDSPNGPTGIACSPTLSIGVTSLIVERPKASSEPSSRSRGKKPCLTSTSSLLAASSRTSRVIEARIPSSREGVSSLPSDIHATQKVGPSRITDSAVRRSASWNPTRCALSVDAMLGAYDVHLTPEKLPASVAGCQKAFMGRTDSRSETLGTGSHMTIVRDGAAASGSRPPPVTTTLTCPSPPVSAHSVIHESRPSRFGSSMANASALRSSRSRCCPRRNAKPS